MKIKNQLLILFVIVFLALAISGCRGSNQTDLTQQEPSQTVLPSPNATDTPTLSPTPFHPSVEIIGVEEIVYDGSENPCSPDALPDLPVRAFRDASGLIQMNLSFSTNYRLVGPDLDSLQIDCSPTLVSEFNKDPSQFSYSEWMGSPYTLDGNTIYALVHNEFYASDSSDWYASVDFSDEQGTSGWFYQSWNGAAYADMRFDAANNRWQGPRNLCQVGSTWMHPDLGCEPTRTWISPIGGSVTISGTTGMYDPAGSDGVIVRIFKNEAELWSVTIDPGDTQEYPFSIEVDVQPGDAVHFRVNARGNTNFDSTFLNPKINTQGDPCVSGNQAMCSQYAITFAVSTDGGETFTQPPSPDHLVATLPYRYSPDWGFIGIWQPSDIVFNPADGYYYVMVQHEYGTASVSTRLQGTCVLRTDDLADPTSWRSWDGEGFNMTLVDPYTDSFDNPQDHTCQIVSRENLGYAALNYNLSYNSFFEKFMVVGHSVVVEVPGFYYSLSDDLVHWSPMQLLMPAESVHTVGWNQPYLAYPALIDPQDTSRNFEVVGQTPYLYFTRVNSVSPRLDFDLVRVQVRFDK
jgi:hypothetical protein